MKEPTTYAKTHTREKYDKYGDCPHCTMYLPNAE